MDEGEREAICLALELHAVALLIDDRKKVGPQPYGSDFGSPETIRILEAAAVRGTIDLAVAMERLRETNARVDEELVQSALARNRRRR